MAGIIVSLAIVAVGLYLTMSENDSDMGLLGAMLLVLGVTFLFTNVYLHRKGFQRPPAQALTRRLPRRSGDRIAPLHPGRGEAQVAHPVRPHEGVEAGAPPVDRLAREPGAGAAGGRPAEDDRVDERDGQQRRADHQQPPLEIRRGAERGDQRAAEPGDEQAHEPVAAASTTSRT